MVFSMIYIARILTLFAIASGVFGSVSAAQPFTAGWPEATVCPATETDTAPPDPNMESCEQIPSWRIDPQGTHIWAFVPVAADRLQDGRPIGLFVSAKASSLVFLNGEPLGENGLPGDTLASEVAGKMDRVYPVRPDQLKAEGNVVALRLSSHAGPIRLSVPMHGIFLSEFVSPQDYQLRRYLPSILPFGAFALGFLYFAMMAIAGRQRLASGLLAALSLIAGSQLLTEVSRGLWAYPYWFQDWRLILIVACSALFGLCLSAYVILRFMPDRKVALGGLVGLVTLLCIILPAGFDAKASFALLAPTLVTACVSFSAYKKERLSAVAFGAALILFAAINFWGRGAFLDAWFYYAVALLLIFLFAHQAGAFAREAALRREEQARAEKLQYVLDQTETSEPEITLTLKSAGRMERVSTGDIAFVRGAGDYSELVLKSGDTHLHGATLADLEADLPASFLRVHRSYLVNTKLIDSLKRAPSGTGELKLRNEATVPVSRRIMPKVREALA